MKKVAVPLAEGFEETEAVTVIDVLRRAGIEVVTITLTDFKEVRGSHGITLIADEVFGAIDFNLFDMIVLPGGMPGSMNLNEHRGLKEALKDFKAKGKPLGAICAAPLVLGGLNILAGKNATCYPGFENYLTGANVSADGVVVADDIVTGSGVAFALDFSLKIVELLAGREIAASVASKMLCRY